MQQDQRQREAYEVSRLEANQMRSRWDNILLENESRWKNIEVDQDQRRSSEERRAAQVRVQLDELAGLVKQLSQEKDALWRVQNAQADAMKKWPRIWLEEIEKAIAHDPNQRRQPALVPVRED
jgi:hypothetical protein